MSLVAPKAKPFDLVPEGNHVARLYQIIHIGTVSDEWQGEPRLIDKLRFTWELCEEKKVFKEGEEAKPFAISSEMTFSMGKKANLRKIVEGMLGKELSEEKAALFDLETLLGAACLLNVFHKENAQGVTKANVKSTSPIPKGMHAPEVVNPTRMLDIRTMPLDEIEALPEWLANKMKSSREYQDRVSGHQPGDAHDSLSFNPDDVPF